MQHKHLPLCYRVVTCASVKALFPLLQSMGGGVYHHILILQRQRDGISVYGEHPLGIAYISHPEILRGRPAAQRGLIAQQGQQLAGLKLRGYHSEEQRAAEDRYACGALLER